jgi:hypothetical protein
MSAIILDRVAESTTSVIGELFGGDWTAWRINPGFMAVPLGWLGDSNDCSLLLLDEARALGDRHFFGFKGQTAR